MKTNLTLSVIIILLFTTISIQSFSQETVYNNFGPGHDGWDYNYGLGWTIAGENVSAQYGVEQALGFTSEFNGVVTDIWLAISFVPMSNLPDTVILRLTTNPDGLPPDTSNIMEEWTLTEFGSWSQWNTPIYLAGNGTSELAEGESYWLWAIGKETTWTMWCMNEDPTLTAPHTIRREGEDWLSISQETASAFRIDIDFGVGINDQQTTLNTLHQNYPNPFTETTTITYSLEKADYVSLKVLDITGKEIQTLTDGYQDKGLHSIDFNARQLGAGFYLYKLEVGNQLVDIRKMIYRN